MRPRSEIPCSEELLLERPSSRQADDDARGDREPDEECDECECEERYDLDRCRRRRCRSCSSSSSEAASAARSSSCGVQTLPGSIGATGTWSPSGVGRDDEERRDPRRRELERPSEGGVGTTDRV
jgi:hypothetical protein